MGDIFLTKINISTKNFTNFGCQKGRFKKMMFELWKIWEKISSYNQKF